MKFNSQICTTKEQSARLLFVLNSETADCYHYSTDSQSGISQMDDDYLPHLDTVAWSLHRLIEILNNWGIDFSIKGKTDPYEYVISLIESYFIKKAIEGVHRIIEEKYK